MSQLTLLQNWTTQRQSKAEDKLVEKKNKASNTERPNFTEQMIHYCISRLDI